MESKKIDGYIVAFNFTTEEDSTEYYHAYLPFFGSSAISATGDTVEETLDLLKKVKDEVFAHWGKKQLKKLLQDELSSLPYYSADSYNRERAIAVLSEAILKKFGDSFFVPEDKKWLK